MLQQRRRRVWSRTACNGAGLLTMHHAMCCMSMQASAAGHCFAAPAWSNLSACPSSCWPLPPPLPAVFRSSWLGAQGHDERKKLAEAAARIEAQQAAQRSQMP